MSQNLAKFWDKLVQAAYYLGSVAYYLGKRAFETPAEYLQYLQTAYFLGNYWLETQWKFRYNRYNISTTLGQLKSAGSLILYRVYTYLYQCTEIFSQILVGKPIDLLTMAMGFKPVVQKEVSWFARLNFKSFGTLVQFKNFLSEVV